MKDRILDEFSSFVQLQELDEARFEINYKESGSSSSSGYVVKSGIRESKFFPKPVKRLLNDYFNLNKEEGKFNFNRVVLSYENNKINITYEKDDSLDQDNLHKQHILFPQWINDRMMSLIYEFEFPNGPTEKDEDGDPLYISTWDNGVFIFKIDEKTLSTDIKLEQNGQFRSLDIPFPDYFINAILEHHEITNTGVIKDRWEPWNRLELRSPHNDLPYGRFDEFVFYNFED